MQLPLPIHSYQHRTRQVASRRLLNCYAEQAPLMAKSPVAIIRAPGIRSWVTLPSGPVRGLCVHQQTLYAVSGTRLYSIDSAGAVVDRGNIPGHDRVRMVSNGPQLVIVTNPDAYVYNGALSQITDPDFPGASDCAFMDLHMLFVEPASGRFFGSTILDATEFDALDFATAEASPDDLVAILVDHRQVFLFGRDSVELWANVGGAGFPFAREPNGMIEVGCGAARSVAKADNTVFWLDNYNIARRLTDLTPTRISTHATEQAWGGYTRTDDAFSFAVSHEGHLFWCLTFPTARATWLYDIATGEWSERSSRDDSGNDFEWRVADAVRCYGSNIVGDSRSGALGFLEAATHYEFGVLQRMEWTYPSVYSEGRRAFHRRIQIDVESGVGLTEGQGSDPQIMLYVSDDGGRTFVSLPNRSMGRIGEYRSRAMWNRLGSSRDRVYRAAVSDPVVVSVWDTQLEVEGGRL